MRKKIFDEPQTKAKKREVKKRPRMRLHGQSLKLQSPHAGQSLIKK